jgi:hypothetical protein
MERFAERHATSPLPYQLSSTTLASSPASPPAPSPARRQRHRVGTDPVSQCNAGFTDRAPIVCSSGGQSISPPSSVPGRQAQGGNQEADQPPPTWRSISRSGRTVPDRVEAISMAADTARAGGTLSGIGNTTAAGRVKTLGWVQAQNDAHA